MTLSLATFLTLLLACGSPRPAPDGGVEDGGFAPGEAEPAPGELDAAATDPLALYEAESDGSAGLPPLPLLAEVPFAPEGRSNGDLAPVGAMLHLDGSPFDLAAIVGPEGAGKAALVAFMASWCGPCEASLPTLAKLEAEWGDQIQLVVYDIDVNVVGRRKLEDRVRSAGIEAPVVIATKPIMRAWLGQGQSVPRFFFVNRSGEILVQDRGFDDGIAELMPKQLAYTLDNPFYVPR